MAHIPLIDFILEQLRRLTHDRELLEILKLTFCFIVSLRIIRDAHDLALHWMHGQTVNQEQKEEIVVLWGLFCEQRSHRVSRPDEYLGKALVIVLRSLLEFLI